MNVTRFAAKKAVEKPEISNLMSILGLCHNAKHTAESVKRLPYRRLVIFADQDVDGSHIAGLILNFLHAHHRSLLEIWPDFCQRFATPIVRVQPAGRDAVPISFFSLAEHRAWAAAQPSGGPPSRVKWFKGLGPVSCARAPYPPAGHVPGPAPPAV